MAGSAAAVPASSNKRPRSSSGQRARSSAMEALSSKISTTRGATEPEAAAASSAFSAAVASRKQLVLEK